MNARLLTIQQAAERLRVSRRTVRRLVDEGRLPVIRMGLTARGWRIDPLAVERFIREEQERWPSRKHPTPATPRVRGSSSSTGTAAALDAALGLDEKPSRSRVSSRPGLAWPQGASKARSSST